MPAPTIQFKRGALSALPGLRAGEPGFTTDSNDLYIGLTSSVGTNKFFGSSRYWTRETTTVGSAVKVVEGSNTGSNFIALKSPDTLSQDYTYTLPSSYGTPNFVLQTDGSGGLTWVSATQAAGGVSILDNNSLVGSSLTSINFSGDGFTATASGAGSTITLDSATTSTRGIASFNSTDFNVNNGAVGINTESIQDMVGSAITVGINTNITVTYDDANNRINHNVNTATTSTLGVASFNSSFFSVNTGAVSIANNAIGLGTHTYGQYAKSIIGGNGLTATTANSDDATDYTINVNVGSGIVISSDAVALKNADSLSGNTLTKWDSGNTQLTNSIIADNGSTATISGNLTVQGQLLPSQNSTYDVGISTLEWRHAHFSGIGTFETAAVIGGVRIGINGANVIDTVSGNLTGTISTATRANTVLVTEDDTNTGSLLFAVGTGATAVLRDDQFTYNASSNLLTVPNISITENANVTGFATFGQTITGTISTATNANNINISAITSSDTTTSIVLVGNQATGNQSPFIDSGLSYDANTDSLTVAGDVAVNGGDVTTTATTFNLINGIATTVNFGGAATALVMGATSGIATIRNATLTLPNATTVNVDGASPTFASSSTGTLTFFNSNLARVNAFQAATDIVFGNTTGITTFRNSVRITNSLYDSTNSQGSSNQFLIATGSGIGWTTISGVVPGTGIATASRATTVDISDTDAVTGRVLFGSNGNGQIIYSDDTFTYNSATDSLIVANAQHSAIKASDGTNAISINNTTGTVGIASDLTVSGNLFVAGSTTQVNTTSLQIEDRLIELGKVQGTAPSDTTWDLGILFNYYTASSNKKASVYWEHGAQRFLFASDVTESVLGINLPDSGAVGLGTTTPQLSTPTFAPIEVGALWVNDTAGSTAVVSYLPLNGLYTGSPADRYLHNVTVDGGTF